VLKGRFKAMVIELWQVKAAYKQKALQNHPDRFPSEVKLEAEARFKNVRISAHILLDYVPSALRLIVLFTLLLEIFMGCANLERECMEAVETVLTLFRFTSATRKSDKLLY